MKYKTEISAGGIVYKKLPATPYTLYPVLWLITKHSQNKHWGFPKGLIGDNIKHEAAETAALREVGEEGGVKAKIINHQPIIIKYKYRFNDTLIDKTVYYFLMEYLSGDPKNHDWEVDEAKFVEENEALNTLTYNTEKKALQQILQIAKNDV